MNEREREQTRDKGERKNISGAALISSSEKELRETFSLESAIF